MCVCVCASVPVCLGVCVRVYSVSSEMQGSEAIATQSGGSQSFQHQSADVALIS